MTTLEKSIDAVMYGGPNQAKASQGYNEHLPGIAAIAERKGRERAQAYRERAAKVAAIKAHIKAVGIETYLRERGLSTHNGEEGGQ